MSAQRSAPAMSTAKPTPPALEQKIASAIVCAKPILVSPTPKSTGTTNPANTKRVSSRSKSAQAIVVAKPNPESPEPKSVVGHCPSETQETRADDSTIGSGQGQAAAHFGVAAPDLLSLRIFAEVLEDLQKQRIATTNRAERGGVDPAFLQPTLSRLEDAEQEAAKVMKRCYRASVPTSIVAWQKDTIGIGEHLLARLLGVIGHPVHTTVYEWDGSGSDRQLVEVGRMDRTVSQLWSYCGHGDPNRKRTKGMTAEDAAAMGNPRAKMLVHLLAECCMKQRRSPYRVVYEEARLDYESRDWTDLHRHNAALRKVGKAILKDLWIASQGVAP